MDIPVPCASTCEACQTVATHLDRFLVGIPKASQLHLMKGVLKWATQQMVAFHDGDPSPLVEALTRCLNEPQNDALVQAYLHRSGQEVPRQVTRH